MRTFLKFLDKAIVFLYATLPRALVFLGLNGAFFWTAWYYFYVDEGRFSDLFGLYLSILGISAALAGISFSYASTYDGKERNEVRKIGESYLYGTVNLIAALIIIWLTFFLKSPNTIQIPSFIASFFFALSFGFINFASVSIHYGITKILNRIKPIFYSDFDWISRKDFE